MRLKIEAEIDVTFKPHPPISDVEIVERMTQWAESTLEHEELVWDFFDDDDIDIDHIDVDVHTVDVDKA